MLSYRLSRVLVCFLLVWGLTGCSAKQSAPSHSGAPAYAASPAMYGGGQRMSVSTVEMESDDVGGSFRNRRAEKKVRRDSTGEQGAPNSPQTERKLIRNATLTLEVRDDDDFQPTIEKLTKLAEGMDGYIQSESSTGVTMMVPTDQLDQAIASIEKHGKIKNRNISVVDTTARYVDMKIRLENLRKMRDRLTELVNQSTSVQEVLEVERELARVTSQLESLEGQLRVMDRQTTYATINVSLTERVRPGPLGWVFYGGYKAIKWLFVWD